MCNPLTGQGLAKFPKLLNYALLGVRRVEPQLKVSVKILPF
jgi:hypothetical protein